jgi:thiol:disulfide interchange protein DsbD
VKRRSLPRFAALALAGLLATTAQADPNLLPPQEAFRFSARALDDRTLEARFSVVDGYYLYRDKMKFALEPSMANIAVTLPPGTVKEDQFFGKVETYRGDVVVRVPLAQAAKSVVLVADSQGCADAGVCYPVTRQKVTVSVPEPGKGPGPVVEAHPRKKSWFN